MNDQYAIPLIFLLPFGSFEANHPPSKSFKRIEYNFLLPFGSFPRPVIEIDGMSPGDSLLSTPFWEFPSEKQ